MPAAHAHVSLDDDRVRVTSWTFAVIDPGGVTREMTQEAGASDPGRRGTEHNVINRSGRTAVFVEVELKR